MTVVIFEESVGILKIIHSQYRTALLNKKYYGSRLEKFKSRNFWLEVFIAIGAAGTGIAGLTTWKTGYGITVWAAFSGIFVVLATIKPFLG
jgi:hypothetical protein